MSILEILEYPLKLLAKLLAWCLVKPKVYCAFHVATSKGLFTPFATKFYNIYPPIPPCSEMLGTLEIRFESLMKIEWRIRKLTLFYEKIVPSEFKGMFCVNGLLPSLSSLGIQELNSKEWFRQSIEEVNLDIYPGYGLSIPSTLPRLVAPRDIPRYILRIEAEAVSIPNWLRFLGIEKSSFTIDCELKIAKHNV